MFLLDLSLFKAKTALRRLCSKRAEVSEIDLNLKKVLGVQASRPRAGGTLAPGDALREAACSPRQGVCYPHLGVSAHVLPYLVPRAPDTSRFEARRWIRYPQLSRPAPASSQRSPPCGHSHGSCVSERSLQAECFLDDFPNEVLAQGHRQLVAGRQQTPAPSLFRPPACSLSAKCPALELQDARWTQGLRGTVPV